MRAWLRRWFRVKRRFKFAREGKWFIAVTIGVGFAAINTGNNLLFLVLGMMLSLFVASGVMSELALARLTLLRQPPPRLHAGRPFLMGITLRNAKTRLPSFSIEIEDLLAGRPLDKKCYFLKIPAGRQQSTSYRHAFARRGRYPFTGFRVSTKFPFGLLRRSRDIDAPGEVIVFPQVYELPAPPPFGQSALGEAAQLRPGRRGEFLGLRDYRPGDDPRDINWRKTAQRGRPVVREHQDERQKYITLQLDNALLASASAEEQEALERAVSLCASLAAHYIAHGYTVRLSARGDSVMAGAGPAHLARILRCLALLETATPDEPFASAAGAPGGELLQVSRQGLRAAPEAAA